jgi:hypothetical protein
MKTGTHPEKYQLIRGEAVVCPYSELLGGNKKEDINGSLSNLMDLTSFMPSERIQTQKALTHLSP